MAIWPFSVTRKMEHIGMDSCAPHKELLSFEDICPQWSLALRLGSANNLNLDIQDSKNCIVGEAHGFRDKSLLCSKCWEYSQIFTLCVYGNRMHKYIITDNQEFEETKFDFVLHFNQKHSINWPHQHCVINSLIRGILSRILSTIGNPTLSSLSECS
jgi:hypothetical protein